MANENIRTGSKSFEKVKNFKYLASLLINPNSFHEERNYMFLFSLNTFSSRFFYKNLKIKIYETIILPVLLYGSEKWSHK